MLDWLRYKRKLARLKRAKKKAIDNKMRDWAKLNDDDKVTYLEKVGRSDIEPFEEDIDKLQSDRLSAQAQNNSIPESHFDYYWSKHRKHFLLTPTAMATLNLAIHEARKRRGEVFRLWLPAITGVISALTAVLAVILGRH